MSDLFARYVADHAAVHKKQRSFDEDRRLIAKNLEPCFGTTRVRDIALADISRWHSKQRDRPIQANRALMLLSKALNLAEEWGLRPINSNPCSHVKKFKENRRQRYLSPEEFQRLFDALDQAERGELRTAKGSIVAPYAVAAIRLIAMTGARRSEILGLQWDWIDWDRGVAELPDSKTGRRSLVFSPEAREGLSKIPRLADNPHVFPGAKPGSRLYDVKKPWELIRTAARLFDMRLHDLRHSFASVGAAAGMSLPMIGALLGHKSTQTTARYAHLADSVQHESAAVIGALIKGGRTDGPDQAG